MYSFADSLGTFVTNKFGDNYLYSINRNAFNGIGSDSLYRSVLGETIFNTYQLNVIIGTDSGLLPSYIIRNGIPTGSRYIFIELPEVYNFLYNSGLLNSLPQEVSVITRELWDEQSSEYQIDDYIILDSVRVHDSIAAKDANLLEYRNLSWSVNQAVKDALFGKQCAINIAPFIIRQLENVGENMTSFSQSLVDAFTGRTAIILAGGPSMRDALPWVRHNRDRIVIIAVSRISRILLAEGIVPHIITSVDPQQVSFEVSREMFKFSDLPEKPVFVYSHHACPQMVGQWDGKSLYTRSIYPWDTELNVDSLFYTGPTVSNYSLSIATHLGCETIILAGVDHCFTREGQTHASGSLEDKLGPDLGQTSPKILTYGGWTADTNSGYTASLPILEVQARIAAKKGQHVINCSLGAAKIDSIAYKPLDEITLPDYDISTEDLLNKLVPEQTSEMRLDHYRLVRKEIERARKKFLLINKISHEALKCCDGLFGRNGIKRDFRYKTRMDKIERRFDGVLSDFTRLVKQFGLKKFLTLLKAPKSADEWTDDQIEQATRNYYEAYADGSDYLASLMESVLNRIDARIEEEKDEPDFNRLLAQWEKDGQFLRYHNWKKRNPESDFGKNPLEKAEIERFEKETNRMMNERFFKKERDLSQIRSKSLLLFYCKESKELEIITKGLSAHPDQAKASPYLNFINGLLAELKNEPANAAGYYQQVLSEDGHPLVEDSLHQIINLSIAGNDAENALLALECLVGISPTYLVPYAECLKIAGYFEAAFDAYNRYLGIAPDDVGIMIRLGVMCREAGLPEPATELFQRVLEKDVNNKAARTLLEELSSAQATTFRN